jgi:hypothetical protein
VGVYRGVYGDNGRRRVLSVGVGRDLAEGLLRLALEGQGVAVEHAAGGQGRRDELSVVGVEECTPGRAGRVVSPAPGR